MSIMLCFSRSAPAHREIAGWNVTHLNLLWEIWYLWQSIRASCCWCYAWQVQIPGLSVLWKGIFASEKCSVVPLLFSNLQGESPKWIVFFFVKVFLWNFLSNSVDILVKAQTLLLGLWIISLAEL
jgi:hypothetical protein